ncbi:MAG TPA: CbiX/SirB N-terminal domain-containing protein [Candidatus Lumbricidophila sp.]|nr:CbiX/SirB N-terminal domain-containing protein [Candidatus Lumbricidophila sp.]
MTLPALVAISHGTSSEAGRAAVRALADAVESRLDHEYGMYAEAFDADEAPAGADAPHAPAEPDVPLFRLGHVDVEQPDVASALISLPGAVPATVVPLLLSAGYHVHVDLTKAVRRHTEREVRLAAALGPDPRLIDVLVRRLHQAGLEASDRVILGAAGSSDWRAVDDCLETGRALQAALGREVVVGFLSAAEPRLEKAVATARGRGGRVVVSSYLLAPGYFQDLAEASGADVVTEPLTTPTDTPTELVDVVLDRYRHVG